MDINQIKTEGYYIQQLNSRYQDLAFISLRLSLKNFFSTYKLCGHHFHTVEDTSAPMEENDRRYSLNYAEAVSEAIVHLHHFVELVLKEILRQRHELLATNAVNDPIIFDKILHGEEVSDDDITKVRSVEFAESLKRLTALVRAGKLDSTYQFFIDEQNWLEKLNELRNRIAHRGVFVLRYKALDHLFCRYALPLVKKISTLPLFLNHNIWMHKPIYAAFDPIEELRKSYAEGYQAKQIAFLKELARAAYENPVIYVRGKLNLNFSEQEIRRSETIARDVQSKESGKEILKCPVCGTSSLVQFMDYVDEQDEAGETVNYYPYVYKIICFCCSFEIDSNLRDSEIPRLSAFNFWE